LCSKSWFSVTKIRATPFRNVWESIPFSLKRLTEERTTFKWSFLFSSQSVLE
jgi:hypothetical protein